MSFFGISLLRVFPIFNKKSSIHKYQTTYICCLFGICRRYYGHKKTIRPNARKLYSLFLNRKNMTWNEFATKVRLYQKGFMGEPKEVRPGRGEFHENPSTCICEKKTHETNTVTGKDLTENEVSMDDDLKEIYMEEEDDWHDDEFSERQSYSNTTSLETDSDFLIQTEEPELEEMLSD